jgi:transcription elongation GreA/GreB family factor
VTDRPLDVVRQALQRVPSKHRREALAALDQAERLRPHVKAELYSLKDRAEAAEARIAQLEHSNRKLAYALKEIRRAGMADPETLRAIAGKALAVEARTKEIAT